MINRGDDVIASQALRQPVLFHGNYTFFSECSGTETVERPLFTVSRVGTPKACAGAGVMDIETVALPNPAERTPTVLVVDDEVLLRMNLSDFLQECGFKVLEASSAGEAVEMVRSYSGRIDLVFSDVVMPGEMDGFGLAQWVRANRPDLPVILCSGDLRKAEAAQHICAAEQFLSKPFDLRMALAQIRQLLDTGDTQDMKPAPQ